LKRVTLLMLIGVVALAGALAAGCAQEEPTTEAPQTEPTEEVAPPVEETPAAAPEGTTEDVTELKIEDIEEGKGRAAKDGDTVSVDYTGWLTNGEKFDSSKDSGQPFSFTIGAGEVISGWDEGVAGMKVGGVRKLTVPPDMGYGPNGYPPVIPPNATLVFEIELLSIN